MSKGELSSSWLRLIEYCKTELPYGELKVRIVHGEPTVLLEARRAVRFDKVETVPKRNEEGPA